MQTRMLAPSAGERASIESLQRLPCAEVLLPGFGSYAQRLTSYSFRRAILERAVELDRSALTDELGDVVASTARYLDWLCSRGLVVRAGYVTERSRPFMLWAPTPPGTALVEDLRRAR